MAKTLFDRIWEGHVVHEEPGEPAILYVDLHLVHEVTSAQAFDGLRLAGRPVRRPDLTVATMDHNVPTDGGPVSDPLAKAQLEALRVRSAHRAFDGAFTWEVEGTRARLVWTSGDDRAELDLDVADASFSVTVTSAAGPMEVLSDRNLPARGPG